MSTAISQILTIQRQNSRYVIHLPLYQPSVSSNVLSIRHYKRNDATVLVHKGETRSVYAYFSYTNPMFTDYDHQRGIYSTQEERLEGGMELAGDGLGLWMEEMGRHGLGIDSGRIENEVDLQDDGQDRGRSRIIAPRGNGLCGAERAAKRRRLAHVNENIVNGRSINETIASRSSVNAAGGNLDVAHENIASTVNGNAINANVSANAPRVRARARTPCRRGGQAPPQFLSGARRPVQLAHAERLMSSIVNASQNLESVNGQSRAAMDAFIRGTPWERGTDAFQTDSLYSLAQRCSQAEEVEKGVHFLSMINTIQFRMKIEE